MPLAPNETFARFRVDQLLGKGGMGAVYKAYEHELDRFVALKVLSTQFSDDETFSQRFHGEARIVAKLEHPNIVPIYGFGINEGTPWMAMRLLGGGTLGQRLAARSRERRAFQPPEVVAMLEGAAAALDHAHQRGVIHRDVKPTNIIFDENEHVYLTDFGIAAIVQGPSVLVSGAAGGGTSGTPAYMSPEQTTGATGDRRSDIYALGIVAYEMLTGAAPFRGDSPLAVLMMHLQDPVPIPSPDAVAAHILAPVLKALDKNPASRYTTATAFIEALGAACEARDDDDDTVTMEMPPAALFDEPLVESEPAAEPPKKKRWWG